jgi:hypothetical protein
MVVGNPKAGRALVTIVITLLLLIFVSAIVFAGRKKTAPQQEPPLHPSSYVTGMPARSTQA